VVRSGVIYLLNGGILTRIYLSVQVTYGFLSVITWIFIPL
jgi:hypothetical protein